MPNRIGTSTVEPNIANKCCKLSGIVLSNFGLSSTAIKSLFFKKSYTLLKINIKNVTFKSTTIIVNKGFKVIVIILYNFCFSSTTINFLFFKKSYPVLKLDIKKGPFKAPKIHARASYTCINLTLSVSQDWFKGEYI